MLTIRWSRKLGFTSPRIRGRRKPRSSGARDAMVCARPLHLLGRMYEPARNRQPTTHPIDALFAAPPPPHAWPWKRLMTLWPWLGPLPRFRDRWTLAMTSGCRLIYWQRGGSVCQPHDPDASGANLLWTHLGEIAVTRPGNH
jgi:hypothetical protein